MDALTFCVAATSFDLCIVDTKHPLTWLPNIRFATNEHHLVGCRSRDVEVSSTVAGIKPCLLEEEGDLSQDIYSNN